MKYEDIEMGRKVRVVSGRNRGKTGTIVDRWPPGEPTVILDSGGEFDISEVELAED